MNSPGSRPKNTEAPPPQTKRGRGQTLRVLAAEGNGRPAAPSIVMPRANTELSKLLAGDRMVCVRQRATPSAVASAEPATSPPLGGAPSAAAPHVQDADFAQLTDAWPALPRSIRAAIMAMVRETTTEGS